MFRFHIRILASAVFVSLTAITTARADAINNFVVAYSDSLGLVTSAPVSLPDLTNGGSVVLGTLPIVGPSTFSNPPLDTPINGTFNLQIGWADNSSPISISLPGIYPLLTTGGTLSGDVVGPSEGSPAYTGTFTGTDGGSFGFPGPADTLTDYPQLLALAQHPDRLQISGDVIQGSAGQYYLQTILTIQPPDFVVGGAGGGPISQSVPEPATWLVFCLLLGGFALRKGYFKASPTDGLAAIGLVAGRISPNPRCEY
jgi:hypothetical protein